MFTLYRFVRAVAGPVVRLLYGVRVVGIENVPAEGAVVIAAKHKKFGDPIYHALVNKRILRSMAKKELFKNRFMIWLMGKAGAFPVRRGYSDRAAIYTAVRFLNKGQAVLIFPEGTRARKELNEFKSGAVVLSLLANCPIVPAATCETNGYRPFGKMKIVYGKPVTAAELGAVRGNSASIHEANEKLRRIVADILEQETPKA